MDLDNQEVWRPVPGHPLLEVSSFARVRRKERHLAVAERDEKTGHSKGNFRHSIPGGIVSQWKAKNGYMYCSYMLERKRHKVLVHRCVALAFVDGHFEGATVDHIDGDRTNNLPNNLRWVTRSRNTYLQNLHGRGVPKGEAHPGAKLKDSDIPKIIALRNEGATYVGIAEAFGVSDSLIHMIVNGKRRRSAQLAPPPPGRGTLSAAAPRSV